MGSEEVEMWIYDFQNQHSSHQPFYVTEDTHHSAILMLV